MKKLFVTFIILLTFMLMLSSCYPIVYTSVEDTVPTENPDETNLDETYSIRGDIDYTNQEIDKFSSYSQEHNLKYSKLDESICEKMTPDSVSTVELLTPEKLEKYIAEWDSKMYGEMPSDIADYLKNLDADFFETKSISISISQRIYRGEIEENIIFDVHGDGDKQTFVTIDNYTMPYVIEQIEQILGFDPTCAYYLVTSENFLVTCENLK